MFLILKYFPKSSSSLWCGIILRFLRVSPKLPCLFLKGIPIIFPVEIILIGSEVVCPVACAQVLRHVGHRPKRCGPLSLPPPFPTRREQDTLVEPRTRKKQSASDRSSPEMQKSSRGGSQAHGLPGTSPMPGSL